MLTKLVPTSPIFLQVKVVEREVEKHSLTSCKSREWYLSDCTEIQLLFSTCSLSGFETYLSSKSLHSRETTNKGKTRNTGLCDRLRMSGIFRATNTGRRVTRMQFGASRGLRPRHYPHLFRKAKKRIGIEANRPLLRLYTLGTRGGTPFF